MSRPMGWRSGSGAAIIRSRMLRDLRRRPGSALVIVVAIAFSCAIGGLGAAVGVQSYASTGALMEEARTPHLVQMHAGEVDAAAVEQFAAEDDRIQAAKLQELVGVDAAALSLTPGATEEGSAMEYSVTLQNHDYDIILDLDGKAARLEPGEIGVPVDMAIDQDIDVGDPVTLGGGGEAVDLVVGELVRDSMMNSSLASSRRLLVTDDDLERIREIGAGSEWLVAFRLSDAGAASEVYDDYLAAGLPSNGPKVDHALLRLMTSLSDGLVAGAVLIIAGLGGVIAALVLSLTVRTAIAEEITRIGVLRAIGIPGRQLRRIVLSGHQMLMVAGALLGGAIAAAGAPLVTAELRLRLGGQLSGWVWVANLLVVLLAVAIGTLLARAALRPAMRKPPLQVMRAATDRVPKPRTRSGQRVLPAWWIQGRSEIARARTDHLVIVGLLLAALLIAVVPVSLRATLDSPEFPRATGVAVSDVYMSLRHDDSLDTRRDDVMRAVEADPEVERSAVLETVRVQAQAPDGTWTGLTVDSGNHTAFPLDYQHGRAPIEPGEVALSELNAQEFEVGTGDEIAVDLGDASASAAEGRTDGAVTMEVVGEYRDITNGGHTAKSILPEGVGDPLWTVVLADLTEQADPGAAVDRYTELATPGRVTDVASAQEDIFGPLQRTISTVSTVAVAASAILVALVTALLLRLFLVRSARRRAISQAMGAPLSSIRAAVQLQIVGPALLGIVAGAALAPLLGGGLLTVAGALFGAGGLPLVPDLLMTALVVPALLVGIVIAVTFAGVRRLPSGTVATTVAGQEE